MYGILKTSSNSGSDDSELACLFAAPIAITSKKVAFSSDSLSLKRIASSSTAQRWHIETAIGASNHGIDFFVNNITSDIDNIIFIRMPQPVQKYGQASGAVNGLNLAGTDVLLLTTGNPNDNLLLTTGNPNDDLLLGSFAGGTEEFPRSTSTLINMADFAFANGTGLAAIAAIGDTTIIITLNSESSVFVGSFIQFTNHNKVYMVKSKTNVTSNTITVEIFPKLIADVSGAEVVKLGNNVTIPMYYDVDSIVGMRFSDGVISDPGTVRLVEAL